MGVPAFPRSIQRVAVWILEKYYHDFPVYNPALLNLPKSVLAKKVSGFKVYSLGEGERTSAPALLHQSLSSALPRGRTGSLLVLARCSRPVPRAPVPRAPVPRCSAPTGAPGHSQVQAGWGCGV